MPSKDHKTKIEERHGRVLDLKICKDHFGENYEMKRDMSTLKEFGIRGDPDEKETNTILLYYDFKPLDLTDPLLLAC